MSAVKSQKKAEEPPFWALLLVTLFTIAVAYWVFGAWSDATERANSPGQVAAAAQERAAEEQARAAAKAEKDTACGRDLDCLVPKVRTDAFAACIVQVQGAAKLDYEWTNGIVEPSFSKWFWRDRDGGLVTFAGDQIKFQNALGTWMRHAYECDFDTSRLRVVDIRVRPGRL